MHKALNKTLAALPDDTKVYVRKRVGLMGAGYTDILKPGHEYTKQNVKFCMSVSQSEPIKKLQSFAENNKQTQGKFTIGDEKVWYPRLSTGLVAYINTASQRLHESSGMLSRCVYILCLC